MNFQEKWQRSRYRAWSQGAALLGLTVLIILVFQPIFAHLGPIASVLVAIPTALAGWFFGIAAGLIASFLGVALDTLLLTIYGGYPWSTWLINGWLGYLILIWIGYITGRLQVVWSRRTRLVEEMRSRDRYFTLINLATRDILNPRNSEDRYFVLLTHFVNLYVADYGHVVLWDANREKAILSATTAATEQPFSEIILEPKEAGILLAPLETAFPLVIDEDATSAAAVNPGYLGRLLPPPGSAICIPLIAKENKLGVVVLAFNHAHAVLPQDVQYAQLAGNQIALALYTVQQEIKIEKQLKEARALTNIERALSETEQVGLQTVLQLIVDSAMELIPEAREVVLHLLDDDRKLLLPRAVAGIENKTTQRLNMRLGEGIAGQVIEKGEVIAIPDTQTDPRFLNQSPEHKFRSLIVAPIRRNERSLGTISVQSTRPYVFTTVESQLLGALGTQAASAIENAELLETTRQDLKEINALYHINQGLVASLDPDQLMKDVVDFLHENFEYYHVQIYMLDPESRNLIARQGSGEIGAKLKKKRYHLPVGDGIIGHAVETGLPFVTNNVDTVVFFLRNPLLPDTQSELTVPIKVKDEVLGVLDIQQLPPGRLTSRDLSLMTAVANQLSVALEKANLYAELQTALNQEKSVHSQLIQSERLAVVGRLLASVSHELNNPLQAIQNALFLLKEEEKLSAQGHQDLEIVLSETDRMTIMLDRLRATYRPQRAEDIQEIQLNNIIEDVHALTATYLRHNKISFEFQPDPALPTVSGSHDQIRQVILNLFMNAIEAMHTGGSLILRTQQMPKLNKIILSVTDTGPGIDPEILPHVFEPFVTTKETGTGLGLAITQDIVRQHKGDIQAENNRDGGATFKVWLPIKKES
jgi:signal transduction histidine kinase